MRPDLAWSCLRWQSWYHTNIEIGIRHWSREHTLLLFSAESSVKNTLSFFFSFILNPKLQVLLYELGTFSTNIIPSKHDGPIAMKSVWIVQQ